MKKQTFMTVMFSIIILTIQSVYGQTKQLSQEVREDFCVNAYFNYKYGNDAFKAWMITSARNIGLNSIVDIEIAIENICKNKKLQDEFFQNVLRVGGGRGFVFQQFQSIGMSAVNAKKLTDYLIDKEINNTQIVTQQNRTNNNEVKANQRPVKANEITEYPNEIYNPQPLSDNPSLDTMKWNVQGIEELFFSDDSIKFPMTITKIQKALKVEPVIEEDDYFGYKSFHWTLTNGVVLTAMNAQETNIGWLTGWLIIEGKNGKTVSGLPFDLVINQSTIKDVEKQLSKIKTQKIGNYIEFRKGEQDYRFEFNEDKTLGKVRISHN
ncbi:hypothetical protein OOZ15_05695 [Galbibacter sp. EGI 63066]|uniref:hypothetical protein n=1 Tax=Galbibacter sp. EGI 63066 TaxID=2993559 RepID=UPI0022490F46|nr:hypothetical protein [Galbibacter sp. EGI 63066]MCX2679430.1 hypothetical protein [Galbibacter sp. EGI 63066]